MNTDSLDSPKITKEIQLVPMWKRVIAFAMDMILIIVMLQSIIQIMPNVYTAQTKQEFNQLILDASLLSKDDQSNLQKTTEFIENAQLSEETYDMLVKMIFLACLLPTIYFFLSELLYRGQTLGKATLRLKTQSIQQDSPPSPLRLFARAIIKGMSALSLMTPFFIPGLINFLFCLANRKRRCLHDLAGDCITVSSQESPTEKHEH
jgi:hypothetical protein